MAIMYARPSSISRGNNRSAVSAAAYRSGSRMELSFSNMSARVREKLSTCYHEKYHLLNENTREVIGLVFDYRHKSGSIISGIITPEDAPEWVFDRQKLWQSIENAGSRVDSRLAREYTIALPIELTAEQNKELVEDFIRSSLVARGMVADYNIHLDNPENPHVHVMTVTRDLEVNNDGRFYWGKVNVVWDKLSFLKAVRAEVATIINHHLEMHGHESRISHLSHAERGLDIIPGVHEGFARWRGSTELRKQNQEIAFENASRIIADPTIVIDRLSIDKPVFSGDDIEKALHKALIAGINPDIVKEKESMELWSKEELLAMYNIVVASNKLNLVNPCDLKGRMLFARLDRVELEKRFEENVRELAAKETHVINIKEEDIAKVARGVEFSGEQKQAIIDILAGSNISVLEGWPGSGKTTVIREIVRHYRKAGYTVIGTAPTNKASAELLAKAGIAEVENTTKLRQLWQEAKGGNKAGLNIGTDYYKEEQYSSGRVILPEKTILIIDEASMVDLPTLDYFTNQIKQCGGKVIKIGDNNQNPAIGYKGGLSKTGDIAGRTVLMENNRHQNRDEYVREMHKEATKAMGRYEIAKAISIYEQLEMLRIFDNEEQKQRALADDYSSFVINLSKEKGDLIALSNTAIAAFTNAEVANLNGMVRKSLKNAGIIKGEGRLYTSAASTFENQEEPELPKNMIELCLGDKIIFKSNKPEFEGYGGVRNNEIGIITELGKVDENGIGRFKARIRQGKNSYKVVEIKTGEDILPVSFRHGYALTGHAVQGADVEYFFYSASRHSGYEAFNVGASRHKKDCFIYLDKETLENVVYGTRDLDISKVKEEFAAYAYKYQKVEDKWKPVDVPLWKVGLRLLISRRTDLNFATDYASYEKDHRQREAYRENIAGNQAKLNKLYDDLNRWREDKETPILENNQQIAGDSKGAEELAKELKSLNLLEIALQKDFILKPGEVIIDPLAIAGVVDDYRCLRESTGKKFKSSKDLTDKINKHVASLKLTSCKNNKEKIKWDALDEMDKNLIIRSLLSKKDISFLTKAKSRIRKYEEKIVSVANKITVIDESLSKQAAVEGRLLTDNLGGMRRYLDARARVIAAQKAIEELDSYLKKPAIEKQLSYEAFASFGIKVTKFNLTGFGIIRAEKAFKVKHLADNRDRISQLKNEQEKPESAKELKRLDNIKLQKERYLKQYAGDDNILNDDEDKHLLAGIILQKSKSAILGGKYREITKSLEELKVARKERQSKARVIVDYYHGFIRDDPEEKMTAITGPLLKEEELIKEEWMISQKKHISRNSGRDFPDGFSGKHYDAAVLGLYMKDLPVLKKPLCPQVTNIAKSKIATLDQKRRTLEPDLEELRKQIEDSRLGKRADYRQEVVMGKLITQLQINYETVRKHAGLEEVKHYFASIDKNGTITDNLHFSRIMEVVELARQEEGVIDSNVVAIVMEAHGEILRICAGHQKELDEKKLLHAEIKAKHADQLEQLRVIEKFRNEELPHFLGKIYKNDGRDVLTRFQQLLKETDKPLMLAKAIGESPEMLGDIKSTGLWAEFIRGDAIKGIKANLEKLGVNLTKYINEDSMRAELQANLGSGELAAQIRALDLEIANLKALLPNKAEQKLLDDIGHLKDSNKAEQKEITEEMRNLFKGDNAYDLLLDFIALKGEQIINHRESQTTQEVQPPKKSNKVRAGSRAQREAGASTPKIDFQRVKSSLTRGHIEQIFRDYAQKINPDGKIVKRGNSISCGSLNMNLDNGLWHRFSD